LGCTLVTYLDPAIQSDPIQIESAGWSAEPHDGTQLADRYLKRSLICRFLRFFLL
jgi:hypothetical protein